MLVSSALGAPKAIIPGPDSCVQLYEPIPLIVSLTVALGVNILLTMETLLPVTAPAAGKRASLLPAMILLGRVSLQDQRQ